MPSKLEAKPKHGGDSGKTGRVGRRRGETRMRAAGVAPATASERKVAGGKKPTPSDRVYNFVLDKMLSRQWPVKAKIMTETELSGELKVSRIAVREAIERLCALGLLVKRQGAGTFVSEPHISAAVKSLFPMVSSNSMDVRQIHEFRRYFEYGNVILFMQYAGPEDVAALEDNYQAMMVALAADQSERSSLLDFEFHQLIARGTRNPFIMKMSDILVEIMRSDSTIMSYASVTQGNAVIYHNEIIRAIKNGDGDVAAMLMLRHIAIAIECFDKTAESVATRRRFATRAGD